MTKSITYSDSERIAVFELHKMLSHSIMEGSLTEDFLSSDLYLEGQRVLLFFIIVLEPCSYKEVKELVLMVYNYILSIDHKTLVLVSEIDDTLNKYRARFLINYKSRKEEIINRDFIDYGLEKNELDIGNGIKISLNSKAFIEKYQVFDSVGFPKNYDAFVVAMKKIGKEFQDSNITVTSGKVHLLSIPTKATLEQILDFWLKLQSDNEKGEPYWESKKEIEHFVNQNFEGFPGVDEIKEFNPNMNNTEIYQVTWTFFDKYGKTKTKRQYVNLLMKNFTRFKHTKYIYSNIADKGNSHLSRLFE